MCYFRKCKKIVLVGLTIRILSLFDSKKQKIHSFTDNNSWADNNNNSWAVVVSE